MSSVERLKRQLETAISKGLDKNPKGGGFLVKGSSTYNKELVEAANSIPGVTAVEIEIPNHHGKVVKIDVEGVPEIEVSYDGGKSWSKS